MGGVIALLAAIRRPSLVTHLVLTVTSGGIDISDLAAHDWRPAFVEANPTLPRWFTDLRLDLTSAIPSITVPSLLLWGDADPISPVAVGERLAALLPQSHLQVFPGGTHDLGHVLAKEIAPLIASHIGRLSLEELLSDIQNALEIETKSSVQEVLSWAASTLTVAAISSK